jgi:hypothetical protein
MKTNNKKARENIRKYIIANFTPEDFRYYRKNELAAFADWCAGLCGVLDTCYFYNRSAVGDLGAILKETEEEKARYTEEQAENTLTFLIYRELIKGATE